MGFLRKIADTFDPPETRTAWPPFNSSWLGAVDRSRPCRQFPHSVKISRPCWLASVRYHPQSLRYRLSSIALPMPGAKKITRIR